MPEMPDVAPGTPVESNWGNDIRDRTAQRYADAANRNAQVPAPTGGELAYLADVDQLTYFDGTSWVQLGDANDFTFFLPLAGGTMSGDINMGVTSVINALGVFGSAGAAFGVQPGAGQNMEVRDGAGIQRVFLNETVLELRAADTSVIFGWDGATASFAKTLFMNTFRIQGVGDATDPQDATTLSQVQGLIGGLPLPFLPLAGGTLTGALVLAADPVAPLEAATMAYADTKLTQAEADALFLTPAEGDAAYVLLANQFTQAIADGLYLPIGTPLFTQADADLLYLPIGTPILPDAPSDGQQYARQDAAWAVVVGGGGGIPDAPSDGTSYVRQDAAWIGGLRKTGDTMTGDFIIQGGNQTISSTNALFFPGNTASVQASLKGLAVDRDVWRVGYQNIHAANPTGQAFFQLIAGTDPGSGGLTGGSFAFRNRDGNNQPFAINDSGGETNLFFATKQLSVNGTDTIGFGVQTNHNLQNALGIHWTETNFLKIFTPVGTTLAANMHHQSSDGQVFHVNGLVAVMGAVELTAVAALDARMSTPLVHTKVDAVNSITQDEVDFVGVLDELLTRIEALEP